MKKKLGDMTVKEIQEVHRFFKDNSLTCKECPLYSYCGKTIAAWSAEKEINLIPLTPSEMAICRALGAKWVSLDKDNFGNSRSALWADKPKAVISSNCINYFAGESTAKVFAYVDQKKFPSVKPGDLIYVGEGEEND